MARPVKALQHKQFSTAQPDDTRYDTIRQCVMLCSGKHFADELELLTSSPVLVRDKLSFEYITVAAHGLPGSDAKVYHHHLNRTIGKITANLTHIEIALVKPNQGVEFINERLRILSSQLPLSSCKDSHDLQKQEQET